MNPPLPRLRVVLLAGAGVALLLGTWTGLVRAGVHDAAPAAGAHGVIMVLGFLGTLVALERAVGLRAAWAFAAPGLSALAVLVLAAGLPERPAGVLLTASGLVVTAAYATLLARRFDPAQALMAAGALAWVVAAALWTAGLSPVRLAPLLAVFPVLTIVGERLELSRLRVSSARVRATLIVAAAVFSAGAASAVVWRPAGLAIGGLGLLGQALWLLRHDVARVTMRRPGLPRYAAVCLLAGYAWLAVSGLLWLALAAQVGGWLLHDAALHALFLGFVISMIMGHAPIIAPAVLRVPLSHSAVSWTPVVLLHASVGLRMAADLAGSAWLRGLAGHGNVAALLLFAALTIQSVHRGRRDAPAARAQPART